MELMQTLIQNIRMRSLLRVVLTLMLFWQIGAMTDYARATICYWDPQGTNGTNPYTNDMTGTWESSKWSTNSSGMTNTMGWIEGSAVCFGVHTGTNTPPFTVTMNTNHNIAGIFDGALAPNACAVTINGSGQWLLYGAQGFVLHNASDGSLASVTINVPIIDGTNNIQGSLVAEDTALHSPANLFLNRFNTYSGGTQLGFNGPGGSWHGIINFNNDQSFGYGSIFLLTGSLGNAGTLAAENPGITINNKLDFSQSFSNAPALNIIGSSFADAGTEFAGLIFLGTNAVSIGLGGSNNLVVFSGAVSGNGSLNIYGNSILELSSPANNYTGSTTISSGTLELGDINEIASSTNLVLAGGMLNLGGYSQNMINTTFGLATNSTIDFGAGGCELDFADSSSLTWNGILDLTNWDPSVDKLNFGMTNSALTKAQLADIEFNGMGLGSAQLDTNGYVVSLGQLLSTKMSGTNFNFNLATLQNQNYTIYATTNLASTNWTIFTNFLGDGGTDQIVVPIPPGSSHQFFRASSP